MTKIYFIILVLAAATFSGCAVGPMVIHETARTVGNSNNELIAGYGKAGYVVKWNYGISEDLDLGIHWESLSIGARLKYAFVNKPQGFSFATAIGTGTSVGGSHYYGDVIASYMTGSFEPYGTARFVHVKNDPLEFKDTNTGDITFTVSSSEYDYSQYIVGTRYWFTPHWLFSLEASSLSAVSSGLQIQSDTLVSGAFGYRF